MYFNGVPDTFFRKFLENFDGNIFTSENARISLSNAEVNNEVEILAKISYKEQHCQIRKTNLYLYKVREPKYHKGLKRTSFILRRW